MMSRLRFEGYVIVSADGMLANADHVMPDSLKFEGDQRFFNAALDQVDLIVHGRNSFEGQPNSPQRTRIILTRAVAGVAPDPDNPKATLWNPEHATFDAARAHAGVQSGTIAVIGGPKVFAMFLRSYDVFWLSEAHRVHIPGGLGAFPGVPAQSLAEILSVSGLLARETRTLDEGQQVTVTAWRRPT